jgi:hypothetical protein
MLDPIALLQSLTLPAGATTGARIELGVQTGTIVIFNSANQEVGRIDSTGVITITDPVNGDNIILSASNPPVIKFTPAPIVGHAVGTGSIGQQNTGLIPFLLVDSPSRDGGDRAQIALQADVGSKPKVLVSNGTDATDACNMDVFGQLNVVKPSVGPGGTLDVDTDLTLNGVSYPRGIGAGLVARVTSATGPITTTATRIAAVQFTLIEGRRYRVRGHSNIGGAALDARCSVDLYHSTETTRFCSSVCTCRLAVVGSSSMVGEPEGILDCIASPSSNWEVAPGLNIISLVFQGITAATNFQSNASASSPATLSVDDIGPVP